MYLLCVYVPESHLDIVKAAIFTEGGGKLGNYECCLWQTKGLGQFRPLDGSDPYLGQSGCVETVIEYKLEVIVAEACISRVVDAMKLAHPYEVPAYYYLPVAY
jgi:hypothetical protein